MFRSSALVGVHQGGKAGLTIEAGSPEIAVEK